MQIDLQNINKSFGTVHANKNISATFREGRIIAVLGENGAGKSTLMKILSGFQPADTGKILINGSPVNYTGPLAAIANGIGMLQQDPLDVMAFTVLENFNYGLQERRKGKNYPMRLFGGLTQGRGKAREKLAKLCDQTGFHLPADKPVSELSIAQRQQLEILRLLARDVQTLILDEPTTGISATQKDMLFETLRQLARDGMTILLVSHKLEDVIALCDEVIVLRAGELVGARDLPATKQELVEMMFGEELTLKPRDPQDLSAAKTILTVKNLILHDDRLNMQNISLNLRAGEIVGFAGLDGSGQELLMRACAGLHAADSGAIMLDDQDFTKKQYRDYLRAGVIFGAAGRLEEGLVAGLTITEHFALMKDTGLMINWSNVRKNASQRIKHYNVRGRSQDNIEALSGGNQQRVLMAMLPDDPTLMILEQPTRGLDVDSASWIWEQLLERCNRGTAMLFSSADLDELMTYSDRILVCYAGNVAMVDNPQNLTVNDLGHLIGGEAIAGYGFAKQKEGV